jgi:carotenoid cleavage dioxygenase-like enzyme
VEGVIWTASNTNIIFHRGATKEDGPPFAMGPITLETIGKWDFEGQIKTPTFCAHPKFDPETGDMICFGYKVGGNGNDGNCDVVVYTMDENGKKTEEAWYEAPFCGMNHNYAITKNWVILPMTRLECKLDRMKKGRNHWAWNLKLDQCYGVVLRHSGKPEDIRWFRFNNAFHGHVAGAYEADDGDIIMALTVANGNVFFFFCNSR